MSEKFSGRKLVAAVAGPRQWSDTRQSWLNRAARRAGVPYRTVKAIFYGEITSPSHPCVRLMRLCLERRSHSLAERCERIARAMEVADPEFYRQDILGRK